VTRLLALAAVTALAVSCSTTPPPPYDYGPYLAHMPRTILVLPPLNESPEVEAPYSFLSTVTAPLAERGYYVFPVAVVDEMLKQNGCPTPGEMHQVPLEKFRDVFGADAVLYLKVREWGTSYHVIDSVTTVAVEGRLVDVATGVEFWSGSAMATHGSSQGQSDLFGMLAAALVNQVVSSAADPAHNLAPAVSAGFVNNPHHGMLLGPRDPGYEADQKKRREPVTAAAAK
jgi:hypothetical protein